VTTSTWGPTGPRQHPLEEHKLCLLVMIAVRSAGRKELVALADGYRESTEAWADLLRDAARRGMRAPVLAVGDGALRCGRR
jgi:transposase-like protein